MKLKKKILTILGATFIVFLGFSSFFLISATGLFAEADQKGIHQIVPETVDTQSSDIFSGNPSLMPILLPPPTEFVEVDLLNLKNKSLLFTSVADIEALTGLKVQKVKVYESEASPENEQLTIDMLTERGQGFGTQHTRPIAAITYDFANGEVLSLSLTEIFLNDENASVALGSEKVQLSGRLSSVEAFLTKGLTEMGQTGPMNRIAFAQHNQIVGATGNLQLDALKIVIENLELH